MPRRRMISPDFWTDSDIRKLTREQRLFFIGCISHADDEGRLLAHPAYLKASIFMYDDDLDLASVKKMRDDTLAIAHNLVIYANGHEEYMAFLKWSEHQKPSRPTPSNIPAPPKHLIESLSDSPHDSISEPHHEPLTESPRASLGQSSLGKVSLGQGSIVKVDFTKFSNNGDGLTDFLTTTIDKHVSGGQPAVAMDVVQQFWEQIVGQRLKDDNAFQVIFQSLKTHPPRVVATALVKAAKYRGGKYNPGNYYKKVLDEKSAEAVGGKPAKERPGLMGNKSTGRLAALETDVLDKESSP